MIEITKFKPSDRASAEVFNKRLEEIETYIKNVVEENKALKLQLNNKADLNKVNHFAETNYFYKKIIVNYPQSITVRHVDGANNESIFLNYNNTNGTVIIKYGTEFYDLGQILTTLKSKGLF